MKHKKNQNPLFFFQVVFFALQLCSNKKKWNNIVQNLKHAVFITFQSD